VTARVPWGENRRRLEREALEGAVGRWECDDNRGARKQHGKTAGPELEPLRMPRADVGVMNGRSGGGPPERTGGRLGGLR
jgi:hypothetical protein